MPWLVGRVAVGLKPRPTGGVVWLVGVLPDTVACGVCGCRAEATTYGGVGGVGRVSTRHRGSVPAPQRGRYSQGKAIGRANRRHNGGAQCCRLGSMAD